MSVFDHANPICLNDADADADAESIRLSTRTYEEVILDTKQFQWPSRELLPIAREFFCHPTFSSAMQHDGKIFLGIRRATHRRKSATRRGRQRKAQTYGESETLRQDVADGKTSLMAGRRSWQDVADGKGITYGKTSLTARRR